MQAPPLRGASEAHGAAHGARGTTTRHSHLFGLISCGSQIASVIKDILGLKLVFMQTVCNMKLVNVAAWPLGGWFAGPRGRRLTLEGQKLVKHFRTGRLSHKTHTTALRCTAVL